MRESSLETPLTSLEAPLTSIRGSRGHLADIIPDKYRLARPEDSGRCVLCGVNMAMTEVLGEHKEGAHIIIVTRAGADTLSDMDMLAIREYVEYYQVSLQSNTKSAFQHVILMT